MQNGSIMRSKRLKGPDVWEFRWRESGPDGKRKQRRMVVGSIRQFADESAALRTISALRRYGYVLYSWPDRLALRQETS